MNNAESLSISIVHELGEKHTSITNLESGSTSTAYKVVTNCSDYVLRIADPNVGKKASYESDFQIRNSLWKEGLPVAKPIATDQSIQLPYQEKWALDEYRVGSHPIRGSISPQISSQLGSLLRVMHGLPVVGYGRLDNSREEFIGVAKTPKSGFLMRFESPWPFSPDSLDGLPSIRALPALMTKLQRLESALRQLVSECKSTIVHSDLHERQLLVHEGKLTALLDFNDAVVGAPEWDLGSYLYFHGRDSFDNLLDGYTSDAAEKSAFKESAVLASILVALHHGNRGIVLDRPHRSEASVRFLKEILV